MSRGFPGGPLLRNPPCNAGDMGLIPGGETKIPLATQQLSPCTTTRESVRCNKRSHMMQLRPEAAK